MLKPRYKTYLKKKSLYKAALVAKMTASYGEINDNYEIIVNSLSKLAGIYISKNKFDKALVHLEKALTVNMNKIPRFQSPLLFSNYGRVLMEKNKYDLSLEYLLKALKAAKENNVIEENINIYMTLQYYFYNLSDIDSVEKYGLEGLEVAKKMGDKSIELAFVNNLGTVYISKDEFRKAAEYFEKSSQYMENTESRLDW